MSKILIVDDEPSIRITCREFLIAEGFAVETAENADDALDMMKRGRFDVVVSDIVMHGLTGIELLKKVRAIDPLMQVIIITGEPSLQTATEAVRAGAVDYLIKPVTKEMLLKTVRQALRVRGLEYDNLRYSDELEKLVAERTRQLSQALEDLHKTQRELIRQERINALGQMASGIAHDFNNALMAIMGYADILKTLCNRDGLDNEYSESLQIIRDAAEDAAAVVRRLRQFYKPDENILLAEVDITNMLEHVRSITKPRWSAAAAADGASIAFDIQVTSAPLIAGHEPELREVFTNLVMNAVDAMPEGGNITVASRTEADYVVISFSDNGCGMDEEVRLRCIEPFYTTKGPVGSGLGLAVCHGIIQRHGGRMKIDSSVGKGTTFHIWLRKAGAQQIASADKSGKHHKPAGPLNILLVDDDPKTLKLLKNYLETEQHSLQTAPSGETALDILEKNTFDLVITDRAMGKVNGDAVAAFAKQKKAAKRVIMLTGFGDLMEARQEKPPGVDMVLGKPVDQNGLREAIAAVMS